MKRLKILALLTFVASVSAFTAYTMAYTNVARIGPFYTSTHAFDSSTMGNIGGRVVTMVVAASESVSVGDVVYELTRNQVKRDTILANYNTVAGVVVGGQRTNMQAAVDSANVGTLAATAGQRVLILTSGRTWVRTDTAATFGAGLTVIPSNKQGQRGKVMAKTTAIDSFYRSVGRLVDSGVTNSKRILEVRIK